LPGKKPVTASRWSCCTPSRSTAELASRHHVITPDFRGHGETSLPDEDSTMDRLAEDIHGLLDELGLRRVVLGGLSMGGYVSFAFYRRYPERVLALILADTRAGADTEEARRARAELAAIAEKEGSAAVAEQTLPKLVGASTQQRNPQLLEAVRQMIHTTPPAGIASALRGMAGRPDSNGLLPKIQCPTLILVGEEDTLTPPSEAEAMAKVIPGARLGKISDAGHLSNLEQPIQFDSLLYDFLAEAPAP
jgi:pimeloyl-ACP methyl ester carboxylesterase